MSTQWNLIWSDDFTGNKLDSSKWTYEVNGYGGWNNELQYYTDSSKNSDISNGIFTINALKENYDNKNYTSVRVNTKSKFSFTYGRIEVRAKLPIGKGLWPAIWLLPEKEVYGQWPLSGEIDIMEMLGHDPAVIYGSINYGDPKPNNKTISTKFILNNSNFSNEYHTFSVEWFPNKIQWFVDGNLYSTITPENLGKYLWPFDQAFYIILNVAVGGDWPGYPDNTTIFPQQMNIDYIRVYQANIPPILPPILPPFITSELLSTWTNNNQNYYVYQVKINNIINIRIKDIHFKVPSDIDQIWNCIVSNDILSLPNYVTDNSIHPNQIYTFGGIFKTKPNFEPKQLIFF